eukprot:Skav203465  [mRNA]  locus=scaffold2161:187313:194763:+ [translate_table: standard]
MVKYTFPELKGLETEYIVPTSDKRRQATDWIDESGFDLFREECKTISQSSSSPPFQELLKHSHAQPGPAPAQESQKRFEKHHFANQLLLVENALSARPADCEFVARNIRYDREVLDFCHAIEQQLFCAFSSNGRPVGKAAKLHVVGFEVSVDIAIQERFGMYFCKVEFIQELQVLYQRCPAVQPAPRMVKYTFPELKGLETEYIVPTSDNRRQETDWIDESGFDLFREECKTVSQSSSSPPFQELLKHSHAQPGPAPAQESQKRFEKHHFANQLLLVENAHSARPADCEIVARNARCDREVLDFLAQEQAKGQHRRFGQGYASYVVAMEGEELVACAQLGRLALGGYFVLRCDFVINMVLATWRGEWKHAPLPRSMGMSNRPYFPVHWHPIINK